MKEWGLLVIEHIHVVDPTFVQNWRDGVFNRPKLGADGAFTMAKTHDRLFIVAFLDGRDRRILSVDQHPRSQQKEIVMVAGANIKPRVYFMYYTIHRDGRQGDKETE